MPPWLASAAPRESAGEGLFQFSLSEILGLLVVICLLLGILRNFSRTWAAFLAGIVLFLSLVVIHVLKLEWPIVRLGWWALLTVYVLLCIAAMVAG